jgi:hypothetical protein
MTDESVYQPELVHCGCDWITVTTQGGIQSSHLFEAGQFLIREAVTQGNQKKPWSMSGFHGYKAGCAQVGTREKEVMVRLSSDFAHQYWKEVYDDADNCTRFDVQATFRVSAPVGPLIKRHFDQAKRVCQKRLRAPTLSALYTNNGPSTLYFNRRISESFGRIYDKGAESKLDHWRDCIRYEVEFKGSEAKRKSASIRLQSNPDVAAGWLAISFFSGRGIRLGKSTIYLQGALRTPNYSSH